MIRHNIWWIGGNDGDDDEKNIETFFLPIYHTHTHTHTNTERKHTHTHTQKLNLYWN